MAQSIPSLPQSFVTKKKKILKNLSIPADEYDDLSPKGSIDEGIRDLIDEINTIEGLVTTSSCGGRISVFLEGKKSDGVNESNGDDAGERVEAKSVGVGGKGGGGRWLFVSHDPIPPEDFVLYEQLLGLEPFLAGDDRCQRDAIKVGSRLIHFKFEPMILHVLAASLMQAQTALSAALQAGFRESGVLNVVSSNTEPATPMVGIRSMGLALESIVGFENDGTLYSMVPMWQFWHLLQVSNQRFVENAKKIERFRAALKELSREKGAEIRRKGQEGDEWEDTDARKARKKAEGKMKAEATRKCNEGNASSEQEDLLDTGLLGI